MPAPYLLPSTFGSALPPTALAAGGNVAVAVDLSTVLETATFGDLVTGSPAPSKPTTFAAYTCYSATTTTADVAAGATALPVAAVAGLTPGRLVAITPPSGPGELCSIAGTPTGSSVPCTATTQGYPAGSTVWLFGQMPYPQSQPAEPNGTWRANQLYTTPTMTLGAGRYILAVTAGDRPVAVAITCVETPGFQ